MTPAIETTGLTKQWGDLVAVRDLHLSVPRGECYAFLGRNGSGKSTTARMLLDFIRPTRGSSRVLGEPSSDPRVRARVGYLPGDLNLPRAMTGEDAFAFYGDLQGGTLATEVDALVERFGLDPGRPVRELSTGNRRKVGLVLAFMHRPELLILDEPTSGLDPVLQEEFRRLLDERKADGATIWLTSHEMAEVERVADRVGLIQDGSLERELSIDELAEQAASSIRLRFAAPVGADAFEGVAGVSAMRVDGDAVHLHIDGPVASVLSRAGELGAIEIETSRQSLDEVFLELYDPERTS